MVLFLCTLKKKKKRAARHGAGARGRPLRSALGRSRAEAQRALRPRRVKWSCAVRLFDKRARGGAGRGVPLVAASVPALAATPRALVFGPCGRVSPPETVPRLAFAPVGVHLSLSRVWPLTTPTPFSPGGCDAFAKLGFGGRAHARRAAVQPPRAENGAFAHRLRAVGGRAGCCGNRAWAHACGRWPYPPPPRRGV